MGVREIDRFLEQLQMAVKDLRRRMILASTARDRERWYAMLLLAQGWTSAATAEAPDVTTDEKMGENAGMELTHLNKGGHRSRGLRGGAHTMLKVGHVKEIYEMKGARQSIRGIAEDLGFARSTFRKYLNSPEAM